MNVLVTGGAGAIGAVTVRELIEDGHRPVVFSRSPHDSWFYDLRGQFDLVAGDITNCDVVSRTLRDYRVGCVIHLAACLRRPAEEDPFVAFQVNCAGTASVLDAARKAGVRRVILGSSKDVVERLDCKHGRPPYVPLPEDHPVSPLSVYGFTKYIAEQTGRMYRERHGLEFAALRFSVTWGPGRGPLHGRYTSTVGQVIADTLEGRTARVHYDPDTQDDFCYNGNHARALIEAALAESLPHDLYHVGSGQAVSLGMMLEEVRRQLPQAVLEFVPRSTERGKLDTADSVPCVMDVSRFTKDLGPYLKYDIPNSVRHCIEVTRLRMNHPR